MERLTYDFALGGNHCWQVKGADNLECREVCERQGDAGCKTCPIAKAFDRLAAIEDILGDEYELDDLKNAMWCKESVGMAFSEDTAPVERLRELWLADREGRCVVLPIKIPGWGWYCNDKFPNAISAYFDRPSQVVDCIEDYILRGTKEQAEAALKAREQE